MTRPEIIRADSIDLQDQNAPSAQDHTRQPTHPTPLGSGPPAPHQAEALREVAADTADQNLRSPRISKEWSTSETQQLNGYEDELAKGVTASLNGAGAQKQDTLAVAQNGGATGATSEDAEMADAEGDDGMDDDEDDDDMMDKISSSPSIDDGGYSFSHLWPQRSDSLSRTMSLKTSLSFTQACGESSSPFMETPEHYPLRPLRDQFDKDVVSGAKSNQHHHLPGEYPDEQDSEDDEHNSSYDDCDDCDDGQDFPKDSNRLSEAFIEQYDHDYDIDTFSEAILAGRIDPDLLYSNEDDLAMTIPCEESEDEDDDDYDIPYTADSRFVDSGWGGDCLQESEDIDFEFVYALHTFVATVEGQANATKGDTMVLLDDSNSYWWLVRVVKDSSIGYLPAEHIETPTERLARLNKHRNIDLTSTMLGDQAEKTKNPLKKAIRRRNAKTVTFTAPTYVEASDVDYSSDEEGDEVEWAQKGQQEEAAEPQDQGLEEDEITPIEPLKPRSEIREVKPETTDLDPKIINDTARTSDEIFDAKLESSKSRNGTVRNTDSFFKDDSVETRKITLTPNLLRDDSSTSTRTSNDSKELKQRPSLDKLEKDPPIDKKDKKNSKEKKDKEKKPGMLSGLFKRKDKKSKTTEDEVDEIMLGKRSTEKDRASPVPSKDSEEIGISEETSGPEVQRQPSKLQKQRSEVSPLQKPGQVKESKAEPQQVPAPDRPPPAASAQAPSLRLVQSEAGSEETIQAPRAVSPERTRGPTPTLSAPKEQKSGGAISKILRSASSSTSDPKPVKAKKAKSRVELDDFDSSDDNSPVEEPTRAPSKQSQRPIPGSFPDSYMGTPQNERANALDERLSESPVQVSPVTPSQTHPPPLMVDTSSQGDPPSPISSPSPELIDADEAREKKGSSTTSTSTAAWSDTHLRTFFDDDADIRDLLVVVYDKSGVIPAGPDHPITGDLFRDENAKLADITNRLDGMLGDWLARKMRAHASR